MVWGLRLKENIKEVVVVVRRRKMMGKQKKRSPNRAAVKCLTKAFSFSSYMGPWGE